MPRHQFTKEERSRGGKARVFNPDGSYREDFIEMCETGFYNLQIKRPDAYRHIYETKVKPHMQKGRTK